MGLNLTDGFGHYYRPDQDRVRDAFERGLIVLDTNVLLNMLRYSPSAREELVDVIATFADRCFVPHQIAVEYNRNRVRVVEDRRKELEQATTEINTIRSKVRAVVNNLRDRRTLASADVDKLEISVFEFFEALEDASSDASEQYDLDPDDLVGEVDLWTSRLSLVLAGRVALRPTEEMLSSDAAEATRRREQRVAPGFKDEAGGDYLWWAEVMRCPDLRDKPLVVVSDDAAKGDWRFEMRGFTVGPHAVLIDDVRGAGGTDLILLTTRDLLKLVEDLGSNQVSETTIAEAEKALSIGRVDWTLDGYIELMVALDAEGYRDRVAVIRAAAAQGGSLPRDEVYRIAGIDQDGSLVRFATPVLRLSRDLVESEVVAAGAARALSADYDRPGKASGYSVPPEFEAFERVVQEAEAIVHQDATTDWNVRDQVKAGMRSKLRRLVLQHGSVDLAADSVETLLRWGETSPAPAQTDPLAN